MEFIVFLLAIGLILVVIGIVFLYPSTTWETSHPTDTEKVGSLAAILFGGGLTAATLVNIAMWGERTTLLLDLYDRDWETTNLFSISRMRSFPS